jgi:hypothetical protein
MIKKIMLLVFVLGMIQIVSAVCPAGWPEDAVCGSIGGTINYAPNGWLCSDDRTELQNWSSGVLGSTINTAILGDTTMTCYAPDDPTTKYCCPDGSSCDPHSDIQHEKTGSLWRVCQATTVNYCGNYSKEYDCNNDIAGVAEKTIEIFKNKGEDYCSNMIDSDGCVFVICGCSWEGDATTGFCNSNETLDDRNCINGDPEGILGTCISKYHGLEDNCETIGRMSIGWTSVGTGEYALGGNFVDECQDGTRTFPCTDVVKLDFFSLRNIIVAVVLIIIIYIIIKKKKK